MELRFSPKLNDIWDRVDAINPKEYARSRNYLTGAVTFLSPYISRGVISTKQVVERLVNNGHSVFDMEMLLKELAWRDYFQRVAQHKSMDEDIKQAQGKCSHHQMPAAILEASTGIDAIDTAIQNLYETGYMHNHLRMYVASLTCNMGKAHWKMPSQWMYYHLLDADFASNTCSWQWVAGANSSKLYYANQENINKFTHTHQRNTFLDTSYDVLEEMDVPESLKALSRFDLKIKLPTYTDIKLNPEWPSLVYTFYNLDPQWHAEGNYNRILLLEPSMFEKYPISPQSMQFMLQLANEIPAMQVFVGSFAELKALAEPNKIIYKEHPLQKDYSGIEESRDWMVANVEGYFPSFFAYWKKISKSLYAQYK
ncbi:MAG: deoxyribodipyrimidine photolyase [Bacteroidia bacterium]|nr:deoxyribodipyrimidine photolyase [Bacteroidia bacterium]